MDKLVKFINNSKHIIKRRQKSSSRMRDHPALLSHSLDYIDRVDLASKLPSDVKLVSEGGGL